MSSFASTAPANWNWRPRFWLSSIQTIPIEARASNVAGAQSPRAALSICREFARQEHRDTDRLSGPDPRRPGPLSGAVSVATPRQTCPLIISTQTCQVVAASRVTSQLPTCVLSSLALRAARDAANYPHHHQRCNLNRYHPECLRLISALARGLRQTLSVVLARKDGGLILRVGIIAGTSH